MSPHLYDNNVNRLFETDLSNVIVMRQPARFDMNQTSKSGSSIFVVLDIIFQEPQHLISFTCFLQANHTCLQWIC